MGLLSDVVHPNATGAKELAQIIANGILGKNEPAIESSSSEDITPPSSSSEPSSAINISPKAVLPRIHVQNSAILIENYAGEINLLDVNGNIIHRSVSKGSTQINPGHSGAYIVRAGNTTQKILFR